MKALQIARLMAVLACAVTLTSKPSAAQLGLTLPTNLVFTTSKALSDPPITPIHWFIDQVDAKTQQVSLFYANPFGSVFTLSWSPSGKSLVAGIAGHADQTGKIVSSDGPNDFEAHICVLSRAGQFQRCMKQEVSIGLAGSEGGAGFDANYVTVTWSDDEQRLYFVTYDSSSGSLKGELVEADVQTGNTLRIVYDKPDLDVLTAIWSPNADYLVPHSKIVHVGDHAPLIHLPLSGQELSRIELANPFAVPQSAQNSSTPTATYVRVPCSFSPHGTYLETIDGDYFNPPNEFAVLDMSGAVRYRLSASVPGTILPYVFDCPAWKPDEIGVYFEQTDATGATVIYRYTFATGKVEPYLKNLSHQYSPLYVSPDGNYLAFETDTNPDYAAAGHEGAVAPRIAVMGPNNGLVYFSGVDSVGKRPLWVPPLKP